MGYSYRDHHLREPVRAVDIAPAAPPAFVGTASSACQPARSARFPQAPRRGRLASAHLSESEVDEEEEEEEDRDAALTGMVTGMVYRMVTGGATAPPGPPLRAYRPG